MSRIAGIINKKPEGHLPFSPAQQLPAMLMKMWGKSGWKNDTVEKTAACFGWSGWKQVDHISNVDGVIAVLDGHVYNRQELGSAGTDAELICRLYHQYGFAKTLNMINGDFAIGLYDTNENILWLGRDRFGSKPLYYCNQDEWFAFASRPSALLALPGVSREVDRHFVSIFLASHYRYFDNRPDKSPYSAIAQLPARHCLCLHDGNVTVEKYWDLFEQPDLTDSEESLANQYRDLFQDSVTLRLKASTNPVFTLSGGMDSSSVLANAVLAGGKKMQAISSVYADKTYDESDEIKSMLDTCVAEWHQVAIGNPDVFGCVREMVSLHDEPVATATWLSHYVLCETTQHKGFGSLFGGLGGDELNAGEYEYFFYHFADLKRAGETEQLAAEIEKWVEYHDHPIFKKNSTVVDTYLQNNVDFAIPGVCKPERSRMTRYYGALNPEFFSLASFQPMMDHPFESYLKNRTYQDIFRETAPCCLRAEDRQTMPYNLENFLPFFDHRLVEFMFRVSGRMKIRNGVTKHLLRKAMQGILPEETRTRIKKTGWNAPAHVWFSSGCREELLDMVHSAKFSNRGIYNIPEVRRIAAEHFEIMESARPVENHMMFLWQLVNLELWLQQQEEA